MKIRQLLTTFALLSPVAFACSASSAGGGAGHSGAGAALSGDATGGAAGSATAGVGGIMPQPDSGPSGDGGSISLDAAGGASGASGASGTPGVGGASATGGCGEPPPGDVAVPEQCGNGRDDDLNGFVDENCNCALGTSQPCFGGYPSQATNPICVMGTQACTGTAEFHGWGPCEGWMCGAVPPSPEICPPVPQPAGYIPMDEDCDGLFDEGCGLNVPVMLSGDCSLAACPPQAPFPIGCMITLDGGDSRGCVSTAPGNGLVYFKEGNACCFPPPPLPPIGDCGDVNGTMYCSSQPGPPLNDMNCPINKQQALYPTAGGPPDWGCPQ